MQSLYRAISYGFYPGSMAVLGLGIAHFNSPVSVLVWTIFLCGIVVLPLLTLFLFMRLGKVSDIFIFQREQRHGLYALGVVFSALSGWFIFCENATYAAVWSMCNMVVLFLLLIINFMGYKISAHMAGAAGLLGWVICLQLIGWAFFITLLLVILVYVARKGLSAHSHFELIIGFCLGLFVTFALASFLLTYYGFSCSFV